MTNTCSSSLRTRSYITLFLNTINCGVNQVGVIWTQFGHNGCHPTDGTYSRQAPHIKLLATSFRIYWHHFQRWRLLNSLDNQLIQFVPLNGVSLIGRRLFIFKKWKWYQHMRKDVPHTTICNTFLKYDKIGTWLTNSVWTLRRPPGQRHIFKRWSRWR